MTDKPMILTGSMIKKFCERRSGRTTEICNEIDKWLVDTMKNNQTIVIVVSNNRMVMHYFDLLKIKFEKYLHELDFDLSLASATIRDIFNNNMVKFVVLDSPDRLKGLKYTEIYFDTPELDVFKDDKIIEAILTIR